MEALHKRRLAVADSLLTGARMTATGTEMDLVRAYESTVTTVNLIQEIVSCDIFQEELESDET